MPKLAFIGMALSELVLFFEVKDPVSVILSDLFASIRSMSTRRGVGVDGLGSIGTRLAGSGDFNGEERRSRLKFCFDDS